MVVCGISSDSKPWSTIFNLQEKSATPGVFPITDLVRLGKAASKFIQNKVTLRDFSNDRKYVVTISLEEAVVEDQPMFCIDLEAREAE